MPIPQYRPGATKHLPKIAEIVGDNPELIQGYFVVALRIDQSISIAHNVGCAACMIANLVQMLKKNPDLQCKTSKTWKWFRKV